MPRTWFAHLTVATVVERGGTFLLVEEDKGQGPVFNQPAGHLEDGETLPEAAVRETLEETGWDVAPEALVGLYQWRAPNGETFVRACFAARALVHHPERALDAGIVAARWLTRTELADGGYRPRSPLVLRAIDDFLAGRRYPLELLQHVV